MNLATGNPNTLGGTKCLGSLLGVISAEVISRRLQSDVRGYVEQAWHQSNIFTKQRSSADTVCIAVQAGADGDTSANVDANIFAEDASVESSDVPVDSGLSTDALLNCLMYRQMERLRHKPKPMLLLNWMMSA